MKKAIIFSALGLISFGAAKAQTSGNTNLHVVITDALSLTVNDPDVYLEFLQASDYQNGVSSLESGHLTVTSNQPYQIDVKTSTATLDGTAGNVQTIDASTVQVEIDNPAGQGLGGTATPVTSLSTTDQTLISGATAVTNKNIDVLYSIPAAVSQTPAILGKPADTYTTVVTYTITQ